MHLQQPAKKIRRIDDFFKPSDRSNSQLSQQSSASSESNTGALPKTAAVNVSSSTNEKQKSSPWDITAILSESEVSERLERHVLKEFPKSAGRSFHSEWYRRFIWLEYSVSKDAAFCYACRHYSAGGIKENAFTHTGKIILLLYFFIKAKGVANGVDKIDTFCEN